jgi:hypothetical protein
MIRPLTLICVMLFLLAGFYDYQTTHSSDVIDQKIAAVRAQAEAARNDTKMLQTEWTWLNRPDRLQPFAAKFLSLQQITPAQYVPLAQLAQHLPDPGPPPAPVVIAPPAPVFTPAILPAAPAAPATPPPVILAAAVLPPVTLAAPHQPAAVAKLAAHTPPSSPQFNVASAVPAPRPAAKPIILAAVQPRPAPRIRLAAITRPAVVAHAPVMVAANAPAPVTATRSYSSLGMAQTSSSLPPPVAVTDAAWQGNQ